MNDLVVVFIVGAVCVLVGYCLRCYDRLVLKDILKKESESLRLECMKARKLLNEYALEPQEMLSEGLSQAGIGELLQNLDVNAIKELIPAKYHIFLPVIQGFLDGIKKKGVHGEQTSTENQVPSQV